MQDKKEQLELDIEQGTDSELGKEYLKAVYCHPAYLTYMQSTSCRNAGMDDSQAGIKIAGRNVSHLRNADDTTLMVESKEELKSLLIKVKEERKNWPKTENSKNEEHSIQSYYFIGTRWGNSGNSDIFYFLGLQNDYGQ